MRLDDIGFYTLSENRARNVHATSPLARCELIVTDACNFNCLYCRGPKHKRKPFMDFDAAIDTLRMWAGDNLQAVRFSGGEPTLHPQLLCLIATAEQFGVKRIAVSTNGSRHLDYYKKLVDLGVNDFSISLDSCCASGMKKMTGGHDVWATLVHNIKELSKITYVTVGMVFNEYNVANMRESVEFAASLGVSDIRVIPSAQYSTVLNALTDLPHDLLIRFPILAYRVRNARAGIPVRGICSTDSNRCKVVLDDMVVAGNEHFPCVIHMREGGSSIGNVGPNMRRERAAWSAAHNTHDDPICKDNCLDCLVQYNNVAALNSADECRRIPKE